MQIASPTAGHFCWADLAATDAEAARQFYARLFGWAGQDQAANGGRFTRLLHQGSSVGSLYQLGRAQLRQGAPSHWTPYVQVEDLDATIRQAALLGGRVAVRPFLVDGMAQIALILDAVGAPIGLWQPLAAAA
jgi:predicted enzyme related to lactoylglutathione lyase